MPRLIEFLKTTAIGGLLVIVPVAIIVFVLLQLAYALYTIAETVISRLNIEVNDALIIVAVALGALVGLCFVTGLVVQTRLGRFLKQWFGRNVGRRIPMFNAISSLTRRFVGMEGQEFAPVEIDLYGSNARMLGFLIEHLPDDRCVVFVPSAPVATVGTLHVIAAENVTTVDGTVADTLSAITQWGVDTHKLYQTKTGTDDTTVSG